jgi:hypothetical protein
MKRLGRFIKWFVGKCSWFEALMFTTAFTFSAGLAAGEGPIRSWFWGFAIGANAGALLMFLWWGAKNIWADFKKHDEQVFDILKKDDIK